MFKFYCQIIEYLFIFFGHVVGGDPSSLNLGHSSERTKF